MPQVSRRKLPIEEEKKIITLLISELAKLTDETKFQSFFSLLLSDNERLMLAKRMAVFVLTDEGVPDSQIARSLNLTRITVQKLRLTYQLSKERKEPVVKIIQNPDLKLILKPLLKKLLKYALTAPFGKIPV
jgi:hypothetical protein